MKIYIVRHGESENNLNKKWAGWFDTHLTEKGRAEAREAGKFIAGIEFDRVFSSDLARAYETADEALPGCDYELAPLLREINIGNLSNKPLTNLTPEFRARQAVAGFSDFGGETNEQFRERVNAFKDYLATLELNTVALFTHSGWLRTMLDSIVGVYLPRESIACNNCTVALFEYKEGVWRLISWINTIEDTGIVY